ncbi:glycine-rich extracellular protein 1 isoform X7 [Dendropsophus ebraccatus]|uniref:glycine-rich extracellular protein 1 isoform X7 n=1 Tax=Dendropsophus ebraccatus TaxID=150705 RepID=UPI003831A988
MAQQRVLYTSQNISGVRGPSNKELWVHWEQRLEVFKMHLEDWGRNPESWVLDSFLQSKSQVMEMEITWVMFWHKVMELVDIQTLEVMEENFPSPDMEPGIILSLELKQDTEPGTSHSTENKQDMEPGATPSMEAKLATRMALVCIPVMAPVCTPVMAPVCTPVMAPVCTPVMAPVCTRATYNSKVMELNLLKQVMGREVTPMLLKEATEMDMAAIPATSSNKENPENNSSQDMGMGPECFQVLLVFKVELGNLPKQLPDTQAASSHKMLFSLTGLGAKSAKARTDNRGLYQQPYPNGFSNVQGNGKGIKSPLGAYQGPAGESSKLGGLGKLPYRSQPVATDSLGLDTKSAKSAGVKSPYGSQSAYPDPASSKYAGAGQIPFSSQPVSPSGMEEDVTPSSPVDGGYQQLGGAQSAWTYAPEESSYGQAGYYGNGYRGCSGKC